MIKNQNSFIDQIRSIFERPFTDGRLRNVVFWYDDEGEYASQIEEMTFDNARLIILKPNNSFLIKYVLEVESPEENFLIYSPVPRPLDRENWLLDCVKTGTEFTADRTRMEMRRVGIEDESLYPMVKKNLKFFDNKKRVDRFTSYDIPSFDSITLVTAIASAVAGLKTPDFNELVRQIMIESLDGENVILDEMDRYADRKSLEDLLKIRFGYHTETFDMEQFIAMVLYTNFAYAYIGNLPKELEKYKSSRINDTVIFMDEFLSNSSYESSVNRLSDKYQGLLGIPRILEQASVEEFLVCDAFRAVDVELMTRLVKLLASGTAEFDRYTRYIKERRTRHWYKQYINEYQAVLNAIELLRLHEQLPADLALDTPEATLKCYVEKLHRYDRHYRKFLYHYDTTDNKDLLHPLFQRIENVYVNSFMDQLSMKWSAQLADAGAIRVESRDIKMQADFYDTWLRKSMDSGDRVFVIMCDGLRYEIADEIMEELLKERRAEMTLKPMLSTVPSYTKYGMAAMLPHHGGISMGNDCELMIGGVNTASTAHRTSILQQAVPEALAIRYQDIADCRKEDFKERFTGKKLVYIYLDTIDSAGHGNSPFGAVETAVQQLRSLVRSLVNFLSATHIIITADHGFLYQRSKLQEYDKMSKVKGDAVMETDRRYMITKEPLEDMNLLTLPLEPVFRTVEKRYVVVPKGTIRLKTQGDEGNYVHGGASLQEIVVPVIEYTDKRSDDFKAKKVEVQLTTTSRKITNRITHLEFFQTESVGERKLPMTLRAYFVDIEGTRISSEVILIADSRSSVPSERTYREKFVLKDQKFTRESVYYLVLEDDAETINPVISKTPFSIDLIIANDFGF